MSSSQGGHLYRNLRCDGQDLNPINLRASGGKPFTILKVGMLCEI